MGAVCSMCCDDVEAIVPQIPAAIPKNTSRNNEPNPRANPQSQVFERPDKESSGHVQAAVETSQPVRGTSIPVVEDAQNKSIATLPEKSLMKENEPSYPEYVFEFEEDVCPTCLEEYTAENPRIVANCSHEYHLSCIYEWMERSNKCPICNKLMQFDESNWV